MRKTTKKFFFLLLILSGNITAFAQWCNVTTAIPYSANMPGITNVTLNTINRTSLPIEDYPNNSYVNTGVSTTFNAGETYSFSITHTRDAVVFPTARNNVRVWIDYNHDFSFDDPGETVISLNLQTYGTSTASFTVPASVVVGATRMRVTAKMSADAGHSIPTPCDIPADPIGYHGEIEDYDVILASSVGINDFAARAGGLRIFPNPVSDELIVNFSLQQSSLVAMSIYNIIGKRIYMVPPVTKTAGVHTISLKLNELNITGGGVYFLEMNSGSKASVQRFIVM